MTTVQIFLLVGAGVVVWLLLITLIVVWTMGMSRNSAVDEEKLRRDLADEKRKSPKDSVTTR